MKNGAQMIVMSVFVAAFAWACGSGMDGSFESDSYTDTSGWLDGTSGGDSHPASDAMSDPASDTWWPSEDAASDPVPDSPSEDAVEETEPPPEDVCDAEITGPQILYLSADDSNSMASPVIARSLINSGYLVPAFLVRTYEFTNYYQIDYAPAEYGRVAMYVHMKPETDDIEEVFHNMQIGAQSHAIGPDERRPLNITFVMDTSGSMSGSPIAYERAVCLQTASSLRAGDVVSMVTWSVGDATVLDSLAVSGPDDPTLLEACNGLSASGGTDLAGGLTAGYVLAETNYDRSYLNRVILISDGQANVGITDETIIAPAAEDEEGEGIYLVGVGVGNGYNDRLMDAVTDAGKGAYVFVDSHAEAVKMFGERFISTMDIAVMDVQVELTLPPWLRIEEFHGEEISTDPKEVEPQHLAPNDAMIFHQLLKACEEPPLDDVITAVARYTDPFTRERQTDSVSVTIAGLLASQADPQLVKGTAIVEYAEGLKEISDLMQASDRPGAQAVCDAVEEALSLAAAETADAELSDIASLLAFYCSNVTSRTPTSWH